MLRAAYEGNEALVRDLLAQHRDGLLDLKVNCTVAGKKGRTPLYYAIRFDYADIIDMLLGHGGVDIHAKIKPGKRLMSILEIVEEKAVDSPVRRAFAAHGLLVPLSAHGAASAPSGVACTSVGCTTQASSAGYGALLDDHGRAMTSFGPCGLEMAPEVISCERAAGTQGQRSVNRPASAREAPSRSRSPARLPNRVAQPLVHDAVRGGKPWPILLVAAYTGDAENVRELLARDLDGTEALDVNCSAVGGKGKTPLYYAMCFDYVEIVEMLLDHPGINVSFPFKVGKRMASAMEVAYERGAESPIYSVFASRGLLPVSKTSTYESPDLC